MTKFLDFARSNVVFTNCRIILPDGIHDDLEIVIGEGKITELRTPTGAKEAIDLSRNFFAPGFVDVHVHGAMGRDTMEATREAFRAICDYHASGGTTSLLLTTTTAPLDEIARTLEAISGARAELPQIAGVHVEGPFISREKAGAQNADFICEPTAARVRPLLEYRELIKRITVAPEIRGAPRAIKAFCGAGISVSGGHSDAWDGEAQRGFGAGMRSVTHTFNCMSSARRKGIYRVGGLLEFAMAEPQINCELIADGHHVSRTLMKMLYRAKGSGGISLVTDAIAGAGLANGARFQLAGRDCCVEKGVCLLADKSALAGSASRMVDLVRTMVTSVGVPLHEAIAMASCNPARAVGLESKGEIAVGKDADFVLLSAELELIDTYIAGNPSRSA